VETSWYCGDHARHECRNDNADVVDLLSSGETAPAVQIGRRTVRALVTCVSEVAERIVGTGAVA
jgi:hypothetical protein